MGDSYGLKFALESSHNGFILEKWRNITQVSAQRGRTAPGFELAEPSKGVIQRGEVAGWFIVLYDANARVVYESIDRW